MKILNLVRHSKSSYDLNIEDDFDRPLSEKGRVDASNLNDHLKEYNFPRHTIICSTSIRTRETYNFLEYSLNSNSKVFFLNELYLANYMEIIKLIRVYSKNNMLTVIGHNTGVSDLLSLIIGNFKIIDMPTSSIAQLKITSKDSIINEKSGEINFYLKSEENKIIDLVTQL